MRNWIFTAAMFIFFNFNNLVFAQTSIYPELQVSPRASDRIMMEAKTERNEKWSRHYPMQMSALATLLSGIYAESSKPTKEVIADDAKWAKTTAVLVGTAWLGISYFMTENYNPYSKANLALQSMPNKTMQEQLTKERIAEEDIEAAASVGNKLMWASIFTNFVASANLTSYTGKDGQIVAGISTLLSLSPLIFRYKWQTVNSYHQEYKKKIYGPITMPTLLNTSNNQASYVPGITWLLTF